MSFRLSITDGKEEYLNVNWGDVLSWRQGYLTTSDLWMLADRYAQLTIEQQEELTTYRQTLRDITDYYDETDEETQGANAAADNFPTAPDWME